MSKITLALVAGVAMTAAASARPSYSNNTPVTIPDFTGGVPGVATSTINVGDSFTIGAGTSVGFTGLRHTWVGDLIFTLRHVPTNTSVTFLNRPGFTGTGAGYSGDFSIANSYAWADGGTPFPTSGATVVASGTYAPANPFAAFNGLNSAGAWELTASDNAGIDVGGWNGWTLTLVPTPGAAAAFGLAGLMGLRRRR